jgi:hypothetical protein
MLVSNWAQNYWAVSTVAKKVLHDYKKVFGCVVEQFIASIKLNNHSNNSSGMISKYPRLELTAKNLIPLNAKSR